MEIKDVTLENFDEAKAGGWGAESHFLVTWENDLQNYVPIAPGNRHYYQVKEWYYAQETPPFKFDFNKVEEK